MQHHLINRSYLTSACLIFLLSGCASDPAPKPTSPILSGDKMLSESKNIANLGDRWKKGKQLIDQGNLLIRDGKTKIDEGNRLIEEGEKIQRESEESYKNIKQ
jgi:hypothetical protein